MSAVTQDEERKNPGEPVAVLELTAARQFAAARIGVRLTTDPNLAARFWDQIATREAPARPDLTVLYGVVRRGAQTYALFEFVAGETLEDFVKRSDPASCEKELPVLCRLLDAVEGAAPKTSGEALAASDLSLADFGVARATSLALPKAHGSALVGASGAWSEQFFGETSANHVRDLLLELSGRLPGVTPQPALPGAARLGECAVCSLASVPPLMELAQSLPPAPVKASLLARSKTPYAIAVATAALVLALFTGVGGFLAKRSMPANAGKLNLPAYNPPAEQPLEPKPPEVVPERPPVVSAPQASKKTARPLTPTIVVTRGARPLRQTKLQYPAAARKERVSGVVEMELTIAEDGTVQSPRVLSGDPLLRAGLAEQISKWVYQPLKVNGKPVPMTTELAIKFDLTP